LKKKVARPRLHKQLVFGLYKVHEAGTWLENCGGTELFRANQLTLKEAIIMLWSLNPFMEWA
jgi:hypothetical protein